MWIQEIPKEYKEQNSFCFRNNFLWQKENVYVMDNPLGCCMVLAPAM